jgi:hypothetical protein
MKSDAKHYCCHTCIHLNEPADALPCFECTSPDNGLPSMRHFKAAKPATREKDWLDSMLESETLGAKLMFTLVVVVFIGIGFSFVVFSMFKRG